MKFVSEEALLQDIATINSEIESLIVRRDALYRALMIVAGENTPPLFTEKEPTQPTDTQGQKVKATKEVNRQTLDEKVKAVGERDRRQTQKGKGFNAAKLRDVVKTMPEEFTITELTDAADVHETTVRKYLKELIERGTVVKLDHMRSKPPNVKTKSNPAGSSGRPEVLYSFNRELPKGPNEHPRETPPEVKAIGASVAGGAPVASNGRVTVADTMIQGFVNAAYKQGWNVEWKDGNHLKFTSPSGRTVGVNARPPSKQVGNVIKRDLKRSGLNLA